MPRAYEDLGLLLQNVSHGIEMQASQKRLLLIVFEFWRELGISLQRNLCLPVCSGSKSCAHNRYLCTVLNEHLYDFEVAAVTSWMQGSSSVHVSGVDIDSLFYQELGNL